VSGGEGSPAYVPSPEGRFPANVILDEEAGKTLDEQSGTTTSTDTKGNKVNNGWQTSLVGGKNINPIERTGYSDKGGASRFFYSAKVSKKERNAGCEHIEPKQYHERGCHKSSIVERPPDYKLSNNHPTVKPIALMEYLIRLVTPKGGKILDPFMGSGSTGCAAMTLNDKEDRKYHFTGVDLTPEYIDIAKARISHYSPSIEATEHISDKANKDKEKGDQLDLFSMFSPDF